VTNGIPIGCSHCGGDGQLTGADSARFTVDEAEEYQRKISGAAAGAGNGFTRIRIAISCRQCNGQGSKGNKRPSGDLAKRVREYQQLHERNAATCRQSAKDLLAKVKQLELSPSGNPDLAVEEARLKLQEQDTRRAIIDVPRSREVLEEIKRLLRQE
jgi:RecJ-like exonuclease